MTDHPLSDEICKQIQRDTHHCWDYGEDPTLILDLIRAGYDYAMECIERKQEDN